ncbi:MAG: hypothetical protein WD851_08740 [Pirellulales bacterium]
MYRAVYVWCFVAVLSCGAVGCRPEEGIRTYTVPKEVSQGETAKPQAVGVEATDRMLVAVVPHGEQATFFKLSGPMAQVEDVEADVKKFVESLQITGGEPPTWATPDSWREQPGNQFRRATLVVPTGDESLELAVSEMSWQTTDAYLLANVNRWRGQMALPPLSPGQLEESYETIKLGGTQAIWLDLQGTLSGNGMAPFAGGRGAPTAPAAEPPSLELPFEQETPQGWKPMPVVAPRRAAFQVGEAEVTVFDFSTEKPQMASPLANVDRWRGEIGLPPTDESKLAKSAEKVTISGKPGIFVAMESPEVHEPREATLAAMSERDGQVWFFKLKGPRDTVLAERERFQEWLKSIQFRE